MLGRLHSISIALASLAALSTIASAQDPVLPDLDLSAPYAAPNAVTTPGNVETGVLFLEAKLTQEAETVQQGMVWRIFDTNPDENGKLPLVTVQRGGEARLQLKPGTYFIHAAFGRAGATSRVTIGKETKRQTLVLNAGGLRLNAVLPDGSTMRANKLAFDIFERRDGYTEDKLVLPDAPAGRVIRLNAGTYHIVSKYGSINAVTRADLVVEAGRTTEASVEHRAAQVTLNLVASDKGFPLADTAWSVLSQSGDLIREDVGAVPSMILEAGEYTVIATHKKRIYQQDIDVVPGRDLTIRLKAIDENEVSVQ